MLTTVIKRMAMVLLAMAAIMFGVYIANGNHLRVAKPVAMLTGSVLPHPMPLKSFLLQSADQTVSNAQLKGAWHVLFFGFTRCPGICPTTLAKVHLSMQQLATWGLESPTLWFISIDPRHDTAQITDRYAKSFDSEYVGLSGQSDAVAALAKQLNVVYGAVQTTDQSGHHHTTMNHSTHLVVVNPQAEVVAIVTHPERAQDVARDLKQLMQA
jgi:protein SCO1